MTIALAYVRRGPLAPPERSRKRSNPPSEPMAGCKLAALPPEEQPDACAGAAAPPICAAQEVSFATKEPAGTIVVDTSNTHLYYVLGGGRAIRYGVRVGRDGFTWTGMQKIAARPSGRIGIRRRDDRASPYLPASWRAARQSAGARAMYIGSTIYRIHGTNQPSTIGKFVSSGCIGMLNEDVSDLFERTKVGTRVVVLPGARRPAPRPPRPRRRPVALQALRRPRPNWRPPPVGSRL